MVNFPLMFFGFVKFHVSDILSIRCRSNDLRRNAFHSFKALLPTSPDGFDDVLLFLHLEAGKVSTSKACGCKQLFLLIFWLPDAIEKRE